MKKECIIFLMFFLVGFGVNCQNTNTPLNDYNGQKIRKFRILEGYYSIVPKTYEEALDNESILYELESLPTLMVIESNRRIILYGEEKQVLDIINLLPKENYTQDHIFRQPFKAIDNDGNEFIHSFVNIYYQKWLFIVKEEILLQYRFVELSN